MGDTTEELRRSGLPSFSSKEDVEVSLLTEAVAVEGVKEFRLNLAVDEVNTKLEEVEQLSEFSRRNQGTRRLSQVSDSQQKSSRGHDSGRVTEDDELGDVRR